MSTDFMVVSFSPQGEVNALHRDQFSLGFLGAQKIERASEIKFNEQSQRWDIYLPDGDRWVTIPSATGFHEYNQAREFEVEWLETCALESVAPLSSQGVDIACRINLEWVKKIRIG
jgi:hypothetical protein